MMVTALACVGWMPGGGCALRGLHGGYGSGVRGLNAGRRLRLARPTRWLRLWRAWAECRAAAAPCAAYMMVTPLACVG
ncbi:hypothetical protein [Superficieibacter electus]|uniref:hypothetical protein n=1 Tax=Superficieibacter electus TaxID=2022662 RepID=UPI001056FE47|nr:hypothetical protein [Superficieibacter electus]